MPFSTFRQTHGVSEKAVVNAVERRKLERRSRNAREGSVDQEE
jgi:hypothetical protein